MSEELNQGGQAGGQGGEGSGQSGEAGGQAAPHWFESLPDDLKAHESLSSYKDKTPADIAKALVDTNGKYKEAIVPPGKDATDEEKKAFSDQIRKAMGVPEKAEDYKLNLPEGIKNDDPLLSAIVKDGFAKGMTTEQLQGAIDTFAGTMAAFREQQQVEGKKALETLWGPSFKENLDSAINGMKGLAKDAGVDPAEIEALMNQTGWGDNPVLVRMFALAGKNYKEDSFEGGQSSGGAAKRSAAEILYGGK